MVVKWECSNLNYACAHPDRPCINQLAKKIVTLIQQLRSNKTPSKRRPAQNRLPLWSICMQSWIPNNALLSPLGYLWWLLYICRFPFCPTRFWNVWFSLELEYSNCCWPCQWATRCGVRLQSCRKTELFASRYARFWRPSTSTVHCNCYSSIMINTGKSVNS